MRIEFKKEITGPQYERHTLSEPYTVKTNGEEKNYFFFHLYDTNGLGNEIIGDLERQIKDKEIEAEALSSSCAYIGDDVRGYLMLDVEAVHDTKIARLSNPGLHPTDTIKHGKKSYDYYPVFPTVTASGYVSCEPESMESLLPITRLLCQNDYKVEVKAPQDTFQDLKEALYQMKK